MDDITNYNHKIGTNLEDIKSIYTHVTETNEFDTVYIVYNNDKIDKYSKPNNVTQEDFLPKFKSFLLSTGANDKNRDSVWFLVKDEDNNINFSEIEEKYKKQQEAVYDVTNREYRKFKAKVVKKVLTSKDIEIKPIVLNAFSTGVFAITSIIASNQHQDLMHDITRIAAIAGLILTSISMYNFRKKLFTIMQEESRKAITNNEPNNDELLEDSTLKK